LPGTKLTLAHKAGEAAVFFRTAERRLLKFDEPAIPVCRTPGLSVAPRRGTWNPRISDARSGPGIGWNIAAPQAAAIEAFYEQYFNPYLNFHRPCGVPERIVGDKGKAKTRYPWYATPWEILRQLPDVARHLKPDVTIAELDQRVKAKTDTHAAREMQTAKRKLFEGFDGRKSTCGGRWK
jgi:hypothetical protein